ncbi:MAG: hypothetical protein ACR2PX_00565 [Endozoicomonas sp.]|uniref:hypothetical protein n=1 Tax=Endozoicomonas sp. TaxID=1892382 RepID=UPI003D9AF711
MSSIEARLDKLEVQHKNLDSDVHSLAKVCAEIKNISLTNQSDVTGLKLDVADVINDIADVKNDVESVKDHVIALTAATHAGFMRTDKRFDEMDTRFTERMDQMDNKFTERMDQMDNKFSERFEQLELLIRQLHPTS